MYVYNICTYLFNSVLYKKKKQNIIVDKVKSYLFKGELISVPIFFVIDIRNLVVSIF